ncbi:hypothetical protein GCM10028862_03770 [Luteimonas pelagia]
MDEISIEDLALLEVLKRVDQQIELKSGDTEIHQRLVQSGLLAEDEDGVFRLTPAGVEMCKSLQHRVAADLEAARILAEREGEQAPG